MFKGIYTPLVTLFDENGNIDKNNLKILIEKLIDDGVDGIVILGSVGEFFNISSLEDKKDYIQFVSKVVKGRVKLIIGTGSNNIEEVIELNNYSNDLKADGVLIITPYFFGLDENYMYEYYSKIAQNTKLPIIIYNFPAKTSINLSYDLILRLANEFNNIVGIKDTTDSMSNVRRFVQKIKKVRKDFCVISGFDEYLLPNLLSGGDGIIGGLTNINAKLFTDAYKAFLDKDFEKLLIYQDKINNMTELYDLTNPFIVGLKEAVKVSLKLDINTTIRNYDIKIDEEIRGKIKKLVQS
ncbi:4-hydroxy-tetrahydrodipicolinate synthase [Clostridium saccharoperbutylacetonicum]|uniref:Putative 2-keto-3-deoxy-galactonate aldolase YagE n=1 Tax=Clostridium saccharoperbutylacetonicum N1-4(HMT) TaxID=931276 RepID=M1MI48_9CLOT|nr:dihydrodipicolinate synthase family protein [Clostridium saccharoperbutylacetonicum]AGF56003.1 putative 2-keto-3-deoxy-galactonate aldolase YagE [Clostridium saccharoperbutylacetonicum N1-4(HMT)]NRT63258.1 4-hydroxy-tetrahydrodipicolinate synthase [Clostridium saccharoperbutylacetonicum]NSB26620.1 4-hydroxy-tetrahydrodipicolinate synthase [Clostridium saccharoperbutylacetonicum]NSB45970.1 4-hydroxy-tetrahydrodipicolinate synthase [Clostridium saccharoperbutylacetonicum]